nr:MAG TPA: hypothetical protein [Caudoviricetes sp.]
MPIDNLLCKCYDLLVLFSFFFLFVGFSFFFLFSAYIFIISIIYYYIDI